VEVGIVLDSFALVDRVAHALQAGAEARQGLVVDPSGSQCRRRRLEDPPHADQLEGEAFLHQLHGRPDAFEEELRPEAGDIGPVAASHIEDPRGHKCPDRLPDGVSRSTQQGGQLRFRRQSGSWHQTAAGDHVAHLLDRALGEGGSHRRQSSSSE